jgi:hypothetical protein
MKYNTQNAILRQASAFAKASADRRDGNCFLSGEPSRTMIFDF